MLMKRRFTIAEKLLQKNTLDSKTEWKTPLSIQEIQGPTPVFKGRIRGMLHPLWDQSTDGPPELTPTENQIQQIKLGSQVGPRTAGQCLNVGPESALPRIHEELRDGSPQ